MLTQKAKIMTILALFCLGAIKTQSNGICLQYNFKEKKCLICYDGQVTATGQCGSNPADSHCRLWSRQKIFNKEIEACLACVEGYVTTIKVGNTKPSCVADPNYIKGCFIEQDLLGTKSCVACTGGIPNDDQSACRPWDKISDPILNCRVGSNQGLDQRECAICDGRLSFNENTGKCEEPPQGLEGCLEIKGGVCEACNAFNGYAQQADGKCVKVR